MLRLPTFRYLQPRSLREALAMKADAGPDGRFVAGGTALYPNMKRRHQEPRVVISLMGIEELRRLDGWNVGTCVTLSALSSLPTFQRSQSAVAGAAQLVSTPLLRNMGTLGGNLCLDTRCNYYNQSYEWRKSIDFCMKKDGAICWVAPSSPRCWAVSSSDVAPVMVAIGAEYQLVGPRASAWCRRPAAITTTGSTTSPSNPTRSSPRCGCPRRTAGTRSTTSCGGAAPSIFRCWAWPRGCGGNAERSWTRGSCLGASPAGRRKCPRQERPSRPPRSRTRRSPPRPRRRTAPPNPSTIRISSCRGGNR